MKPMTPEPPAFVGSIPNDYDAYLGPFLFDFYAKDLAERLDLAPGVHILETACGTGIATESLRAAVPADAQIVATDLSEAMLEHARSKRGHLERVRFEAADAAALSHDDSSFDALYSQFGLMFMPDKLQAMREAQRVLRPGGQLAFSVWGDLDSNPYVRLAQDAIASFFDAEPPGFLWVPWSYCEPGPIEELLHAAEFVDVKLERVPYLCEHCTSEDIARGLVCGNPTITQVIERASAPADNVVHAVASAIEGAFGSGTPRVPMQALVVTARR
ncbi:MAG: SAM-dependent methyltransferase [Chlamydiales bacterium]|jgi:SAM-dependent methyltransferase